MPTAPWTFLAVFLLAMAVVATYELGVAFPAACAVCAVAALMVMDRLQGDRGSPRAMLRDRPGRPMGDGGAFPGTSPMARKPAPRRTVVMDGGSLGRGR